MSKGGLVKDFNYGENLNSPIPKYATIIYDDNGNITFEDYSELDKYLEEVLIPICVNENIKIDEIGNRSVDGSSMTLWSIVRRNFCDAEFKHIMNYLNERNIVVTGSDTFLIDQFDNYKFVSFEGRRMYYDTIDPEKLASDVIRYKKDPSIEARNKFIENNMKIVSYLSYRCYCVTGIDIEELNSYGVEGLIEALEKFDPNISTNFYSFSTSFVKRYLIDGIAEVQGFNRGKFYNDFVRVKKEVEEEYADKLDNNFKLVDVILERMVANNYIDSINIDNNRCRILSKMPLSLDDCDDTLELCDDNTLEYEIACVESRKMVEDLFNSLTPKEEYILRQHYGFDDSEPRTFDDIGKDFDTCRATIHIKEKRAFQKIRKLSQIGELEDLYQELAKQNYNPNKVVRERQYIRKR